MTIETVAGPATDAPNTLAMRLGVNTLAQHTDRAMNALDASPKASAALALSDTATRFTDGPVNDEVYAQVVGQLCEVERAEEIWTIAVINAWSRLGATARPRALA